MERFKVESAPTELAEWVPEPNPPQPANGRYIKLLKVLLLACCTISVGLANTSVASAHLEVDLLLALFLAPFNALILLCWLDMLGVGNGFAILEGGPSLGRRVMGSLSRAVAAVGCLSFPTLLLVLMLLGPHLSLMTASAIWVVLGGVAGLLAINALRQPMSRPNPNPPKSAPL